MVRSAGASGCEFGACGAEAILPPSQVAAAFSKHKIFDFVIEVNKDLSLSLVFGGQEARYQAKDWDEVSVVYWLLLYEKFDEIVERVK